MFMITVFLFEEWGTVLYQNARNAMTVMVKPPRSLQRVSQLGKPLACVGGSGRRQT
jgi:hypothetical protein